MLRLIVNVIGDGLLIVWFLSMAGCAAIPSKLDALEPRSTNSAIAPSSSVDINQGEKIFWSGNSGGFKITWSDTGLVARPENGNTDLRVFQLIATRNFEDFVKKGPTCVSDVKARCNYQVEFRLVSVFDRYITYRIAVSIDGGKFADFFYERLITIDLRKFEKLLQGQIAPARDDPDGMGGSLSFDSYVALDTLFDEPAIVSALARNEDIKTLFRDFQIAFKGKTTKDIALQIKNQGGGLPFQKVQYELPYDFLNNFRFVKLLSKNEALVEIEIGAVGQYSRGERTYIPLVLPITPELYQTVRDSTGSSASGFLWENAKERFGDTNVTRIEFSF